MVQNTWMIVKKEKTSSKIKNYFINIFAKLFKGKEKRKKKDGTGSKLKESKRDNFETISTKSKLSKGSIAIDDVDADELDPLINLYRDSNNKLRKRLQERA